MRDAGNLGWKLAMVVKGIAHDRLLDTYGMERRDHARSMIHLSEVAGDIFAPQSRIAGKLRDGITSMLNAFPSIKRYFVEMRFKPMPRYESGVVLLPERIRKPGLLARLLERCGDFPLGRLLGLMSEKRDSLIGRLVHGRDPAGNSPAGRMFIQPMVRTEDGRTMRLDDALGQRLAILAWGADPTYGLTPQARAVWERLGACFVIIKPDAQLAYRADVPQGILALGDVSGRLKDWFGQQPHSIVLLRPDRFIAGMCSPQQVSQSILMLADKLALTHAAGQKQPTGVRETVSASEA
jgi:3-(3-hydroxy-phenyl)propionate hydroxylase